VWYDDEGEKFEHLMSAAVEAEAEMQTTEEQAPQPPGEPTES
jgi:hypothetical protein